MKKEHARSSLWVALMLLLCGITSYSTAQFNRSPTPNDTLQSIRIHPDNSVTFSIYAPEASEVTVSGDFSAGFRSMSLSKDEVGVWSAKTDPLSPDVYTYDFRVDGVRTFDPRNKQFKESSASLSNIFEMPGKETEFLTMKNVPHGVVEIVNYWSSSLGIMRRMHVYLPPGYRDMIEKLPVLYLLHGGGDCDGAWTTVGKANTILDNLYAGGKTAPMIVVMPDGHPPGPSSMREIVPGGDNFARDFLNDVVPYIEKHYNVSSEPSDRALSGLSMGGLQTMNIAIFNPEMFGYVLPLSTGYFPNMLEDLEANYSDAFKNPAIKKWKLFWIAMGGEQDIAYQNNINTMELFDKFGIEYEYVNISGGHTFITWRKNLHQFAPLLFKD